MSPTEQIRVFARVAELASFSQAAEQLGLPRASVSSAVQQLEARLGTRLLHRTTRRVMATQDGQAFYERCSDLLAELDELQTMFQPQGAALSLRGRVRLDMSTGLARHAVLPRLPELLAAHPLLEVELSSTERRVDLVREGFDAVLRGGPLDEPGLVARPLGRMRMLNCASPAYLQVHGVPQSPADLAHHRLVHYSRQLGAKSLGFEYWDGARELSLPMAGALTVNNAEAYTAACLAGLGLIQVPAVGVKELLEQGLLVVVLPDHSASPMALNLVYASRRHLSLRVRMVMDWLAGVAQAYLAEKD
jgi:DNA-binding transcriptional LysR family regulator